MRIVFYLLLMGALNSLSGSEAISVDSTNLRRHISVLAADSMAGRRAGSDGERKAAEYISRCMSDNGLKALSDSGQYSQKFYLRRAFVYAPSFVVCGGDTLRYPENILLYQVPAGERDISKSMVLIGYGIHRPDLGIDSYENIDASGRVVVAIAPSLWNKQRLKHDIEVEIKQLADWAREFKAAGIIIISDSASQQPSKARPNRRLAAELFDPVDTTGFLWISVVGGRDFVSRYFGIQNFDSIGVDTHSEAARSITAHMDIEPLIGTNVVGMIEGTDLRGEAVVLSAHYDHLGTDRANPADSVFNGALDNTSGVAALLEVARTLAARQEHPQRSIIFLATSGEEFGLVGSRHFVAHPPLGLEIVANVNLDVLGFAIRNDKAWSTLLGGEYTDMKETFENACKANGVAVATNYIPSYFFRSDCRAFAEAGIPSIFPASGMARRDAADAFGLLDQYYHRTNDELGKSPLSISVLERQTAMIAAGLWSVANQAERPKWVDDLDSEGRLIIRDTWGRIRIWIADHLFWLRWLT